MPTPGASVLVTHPNDVPLWAARTGYRPDMPMLFEKWANARPLTDWFNAAKTNGYSRVVVSWEPWAGAPLGLTNPQQAAAQPATMSNASIIVGACDDYIYTFARAVRDSGLETVYVRFAHEMNGGNPGDRWYGWAQDPKFVDAWKHVVTCFRNVKVGNARFVWAPNSNMFMNTADFLKGCLPYWPGPNWVDVVAVTGIQFGPPRTWMGADLGYRLDVMRRVFGKPVAIGEFNSEYSIRNDFFRSVADWQRHGGNLEYLALSQSTSRGGANGVTAGSMNWSVADDPVGRAAFGDLIDALHNPQVA